MTSHGPGAKPRQRTALAACTPPDRPPGEVVDLNASVAAAAAPAIGTIIAAGHGLVRAGLRRLFEDQGDIAVDAVAADGDEVLALVARHEPDVVVIDAELPGLDGFEVTRRVLAQSRPRALGVVLLLDADSDEAVLAALEAGATGVLAKDSDAPELLQAVRVVADGGALLDPDVTRRLIARVLAHNPGRRQAPAELTELTRREREVMGLVAMGLSNEEIAQRLFVTPATAKTHVGRARRKLGARDRAQLVVYAYETGLVPARLPAADSPAAGSAGAALGHWSRAQHGLRRVS
jgi:DNA-binding NarL/FixJ family response regulator